MDNIHRLGYSTEQVNLISNILQSILVSTPDRRRTLELVRRDLRADKYDYPPSLWDCVEEVSIVLKQQVGRVVR
jgi:hypothetical protein